MNSTELENQLDHQAEALGVSGAKLRTIYRRGVETCVSEGYPESPMFHGLARVQRYMLAHRTQNSRYTLDTDLLPRDYSDIPKTLPQVVETEGEWPAIYDLLNNNKISLYFGHEVSDVSYDSDTKVLQVSGLDWSYTYDFISGDSNMWYNF